MRHRRGCSPRGGMSAWKHVCLGLGIGAALGALLGRRPWHGPKQAPAAVQSRVVTVVRRPRTTGNHTVVMGQFNTRLRSATVAAWASAWSRLRLVDDVFVAVPISTTGAPAPWTPADLEADLSPYPAGEGTVRADVSRGRWRHFTERQPGLRHPNGWCSCPWRYVCAR